jgi:hypothetical protein
MALLDVIASGIVKINAAKPTNIRGCLAMSLVISAQSKEKSSHA